MKLKLLFALLFVTISNAQTQIGQDIIGDMPDDKFGYGVALSADGNIMAVSAPGNDNNGTDAGHIRVYSKVSGTWIQIGKDIEGDSINGQIGFKITLSDDGSTLAFSSPFSQYTVNNFTHSGFVKVYKNVNGSWTQLGQDLRQDSFSGPLSYRGFGQSISLSADGNTIAIAECATTNNPSKIITYKYTLGNWVKMGEITPYTHPEWQNGVYYAWDISLSADGNTIAISDIEGSGTGASKPQQGYVVVFKNQLGNWIKKGNTINGKSKLTSFGYRIALSGDGNILAISDPESDINGVNSGHVEVYKINGNNWIQIGNDIIGSAALDYLGYGLVMSANGNVLAIGCYGCDTVNGTDTGKVRIFENIQNNWVEKGGVIGANAGDAIGWAIALSKDGYNLAVGNLRSNSVSAKKNIRNLEEQTFSDNLFQANNYQAKGTFPGSVQVFNLSGILSSDTFVLENFNIYPNPTTDILNIELKENLTLEKVLIYTTSGQLVKETSEKTINVSGFAKGIYNVQVLTYQGKATKKIIIK